jgi:D-glycero-D-manno-heptose 1,7-bisphosphate phosphatase
MFPTVFLDKDGTLIPDIPYNVDPSLIELSVGATEGLRLLHQAGFQLIVVSNQSGVARGYFTEAALVPVVQKLRELFATVGVPMAGFYYCPHYPTGTESEYAIACHCRKPAPGLLLAAAKAHQVDLARSWMIGDILNDVEAGRRAGCRTVLIDNGNETEWLRSPLREPHYYAKDLTEAAQHIIKSNSASPSPVLLTHE